MDRNSYFLKCIREALMPSTGCTEPVAIALCGAAAKKRVPGTIQKVELCVDIGLFKNAMGVGIPGLQERGITLCCALGCVDGNPEHGMDILGNIQEYHLDEIKRVASLVEVSVQEDLNTLFIQTTVTTDQGSARAITCGQHDHIVSIQNSPFSELQMEEAQETIPDIQTYTLDDFLDFVENTPIENFEFLWDGVEMNRLVSQAGLNMGYLQHAPYLLEDTSLVGCVQRATGAASFARMSGVNLPTMTATGSGNQGITAILTVDAVCRRLSIPRETELRALALTHIVNVFAKSYTGALAAVCACGVASGLGAGVGIVYALGGTEADMVGTMKNILGGITGMICDGAKEGCANKVALAAGCATTSAMMALGKQTLSSENGILGSDMSELFQNVKYLLAHGMDHTNRAIVDIMLKQTT